MARSTTVDQAGRSARRWYPPEVRERAVRRVLEATSLGETRTDALTRVAAEEDVGRESLRTWVRKVETSGSTLRLVDARHTGHAPPVTIPATTEAATAERSGLNRPLAMYLASRLAVLAVTLIAIYGPGRGVVPVKSYFVTWPAVPPSGRLLNALGMWDAGWYVHVATHSYAPPPFLPSPLGGDMAFFPLFPMLIRALASGLGLPPVASGAVLALFIGAAATLAVWSVVEHVAGPRAADRATAMWCFFPGAFVLSMVYAEGLTVGCAALCLLFLLRRRWVLAGLAAAAAGASQPAALVLVACCGWAAAGAIRRRQWASLAAPLLAPAGALGYFGYLWGRTGDPLAYFDAQRMFWNHGRMGPYWTVAQPFVQLFRHPGAFDNDVLVTGMLFAVGTGAVLWRWRPPAVLAIWSAGVVALSLLSGPVGVRPRFLLVAFPLIAALAVRLPRPAFYAVLALEVPLLGALAYATVTTLSIVP